MVSDYGLDKHPRPFHLRIPPGARWYTSTQTSPECPPPPAPARDWLPGVKQTLKQFAAYQKYNVHVNTVNTGRAWMDSLTGRNEKKVPNEFYWPWKSPDMQYSSSIKIQCDCQKRWNFFEKSLMELWCIPTFKSSFSEKLADLLILSPLPTAYATVALGESPNFSSKTFFSQKALL